MSEDSEASPSNDRALKGAAARVFAGLTVALGAMGTFVTFFFLGHIGLGKGYGWAGLFVLGFLVGVALMFSGIMPLVAEPTSGDDA